MSAPERFIWDEAVSAWRPVPRPPSVLRFLTGAVAFLAALAFLLALKG